jgi:phosphate transport system permease protein
VWSAATFGGFVPRTYLADPVTMLREGIALFVVHGFAFDVGMTVWRVGGGFVLATVIAVPLGIAVALFLTQYAPPWLRGPAAATIDLLAAVPSIIFGLWGITVLAPLLVPVQHWVSTYLGWFPLFAPGLSSGGTVFVASIVLAIMILPIITAITREIFRQAPRLNEEAALALGATRWEMIRLSVFPYARSGIVSAVMLGLGRALGETMAVTIILSVSGIVTFNLISQANPSTIAANIALDFPESTGLAINTLIASGLVLFAITLVTNLAARAIIARQNIQ